MDSALVLSSTTSAASLARPGSTITNKWWSEETVAVVTGANRGIGFAIVKQLAELGLTVVLTARDASKGQAAVAALLSLHGDLRVEFRQLDVTDEASIRDLAAWVGRKFGGLDILVNNAGVSFNSVDTNSVDNAETVIRTNFHGPKSLIKALLPLFRRSPTSGRILNISSRLGSIRKIRSSTLRAMFKDAEGRMTEDEIDCLVAKFLDHAKAGTWREAGWPEVWTDYSVSKLALNTYSRLLAKENEGSRLSVNSYCPGYTRTGMTGGKGSHTAAEAAEVAVQVVLLSPEKLPTGTFFKWAQLPYMYSKL